ncbi:hypothetical protein [Luteolibacter sp. AS25]|uniref:hypothetical protein n=1 Tax=Luteolibacter sp. AS25 TaxID=3135776 RepID=UPI00398AA5D1
MSVRLILAESFATNGSTNCIHSGQSDEFALFRSEALARVGGQISGDVFRGCKPSEPNRANKAEMATPRKLSD